MSTKDPSHFANLLRSVGYDRLSPEGQAYVDERVRVGGAAFGESGRYNFGALKNHGFGADLGDAMAGELAARAVEGGPLPLGLTMTPQQRVASDLRGERAGLGAAFVTATNIPGWRRVGRFEFDQDETIEPGARLTPIRHWFGFTLCAARHADSLDQPAFVWIRQDAPGLDETFFSDVELVPTMEVGYQDAFFLPADRFDRYWAVYRSDPFYYRDHLDVAHEVEFRNGGGSPAFFARPEMQRGGRNEGRGERGERGERGGETRGGGERSERGGSRNETHSGRSGSSLPGGERSEGPHAPGRSGSESSGRSGSGSESSSGSSGSSHATTTSPSSSSGASSGSSHGGGGSSGGASSGASPHASSSSGGGGGSSSGGHPSSSGGGGGGGGHASVHGVEGTELGASHFPSGPAVVTSRTTVYATPGSPNQTAQAFPQSTVLPAGAQVRVVTTMRGPGNNPMAQIVFDGAQAGVRRGAITGYVAVAVLRPAPQSSVVQRGGSGQVVNVGPAPMPVVRQDMRYPYQAPFWHRRAPMFRTPMLPGLVMPQQDFSMPLPTFSQTSMPMDYTTTQTIVVPGPTIDVDASGDGGGDGGGGDGTSEFGDDSTHVATTDSDDNDGLSGTIAGATPFFERPDAQTHLGVLPEGTRVRILGAAGKLLEIEAETALGWAPGWTWRDRIRGFRADLDAVLSPGGYEVLQPEGAEVVDATAMAPVAMGPTPEFWSRPLRAGSPSFPGYRGGVHGGGRRGLGDSSGRSGSGSATARARASSSSGSSHGSSGPSASASSGASPRVSRSSEGSGSGGGSFGREEATEHPPQGSRMNSGRGEYSERFEPGREHISERREPREDMRVHEEMRVREDRALDEHEVRPGFRREEGFDERDRHDGMREGMDRRDGGGGPQGGGDQGISTPPNSGLPPFIHRSERSVQFAAGGGPARRGWYPRELRKSRSPDEFFPGQVLIDDDNQLWRNNGDGVGVDSQRWESFGWGNNASVNPIKAVAHLLGVEEIAGVQEAYRTGRTHWIPTDAVPTSAADRMALYHERQALAGEAGEQPELGGFLATLNNEKALRLFLYAVLGNWIVGSVGDGLGRMIHGSGGRPIAEVHVGKIASTMNQVMQQRRSMPQIAQRPAQGRPLFNGVGGVESGGDFDAVEKLARDLGAIYSPDLEIVWMKGAELGAASEVSAAGEAFAKAKKALSALGTDVSNTNGWRLVLYTLIAAWSVGTVTRFVESMLHGPSRTPLARVHVDQIMDTVENTASKAAKSGAAATLSTVAKSVAPSPVKKAGIGSAGAKAHAAIDALAKELSLAGYEAPEGFDIEGDELLGVGLGSYASEEDAARALVQVAYRAAPRDWSAVGGRTIEALDSYPTLEQEPVFVGDAFPGVKEDDLGPLGFGVAEDGRLVGLDLPMQIAGPDLGRAPYIANDGDTAQSIAALFDATTRPHWAGELATSNPGMSWNHLYSGQPIQVPAAWPDPFWKAALQGTPVLSPLGWLPGRGPTAAAEETMLKLTADWEGFERAGVGGADARDFRVAQKAWRSGEVLASEVAPLLQGEIARARRVRARLMDVGATAAENVLYVDFTGKKMIGNLDAQGNWKAEEELYDPHGKVLANKRGYVYHFSNGSASERPFGTLYRGKFKRLTLAESGLAGALAEDVESAVDGLQDGLAGAIATVVSLPVRAFEMAKETVEGAGIAELAGASVTAALLYKVTST